MQLSVLIPQDQLAEIVCGYHGVYILWLMKYGYRRLPKSCNKQAELWKTTINLTRMNLIIFPPQPGPFLLVQTQSINCGFRLASFPGPRPASRRLPYCKRLEAGRGPGNEASFPLSAILVARLLLVSCPCSLCTPPCEERSSERSQISWAYFQKVVRTNEVVRSVIIT